MTLEDIFLSSYDGDDREGESWEPCPFCGSRYVKDVPHYDYWGKLLHYTVTCQDCLAAGPPAETVTDAIRDWNHRG